MFASTAFVLLTAACAQVQVPLPGGVPMTLQTFAVSLSAIALGPGLGAAAMLSYVLLGAVGLPVFADFSAGHSVVLGVTGGYLLGFVLCQPIAAAIARRAIGAGGRASWIGLALASVVAHAIVFAVGVPWLKLASGMAWQDAAFHGLVVFIPGTIVKAVLAASVAQRIAPWKLVP